MNSSFATNFGVGILIILFPLPFARTGNSSILNISNLPIFDTAAI